jgi:hypothetical protein
LQLISISLGYAGHDGIWRLMSEQIAAPARQVSPTRLALVALGLIPTGAAAGAFAGGLGATILISVTEGLRAALDPTIAAIAAVIGGACGAVLLPLAGLTVLRYVPLGRALAETIVGTAIGGALGGQFWHYGWLLGALAGFGVAVIRLRMAAQRAQSR